MGIYINVKGNPITNTIILSGSEDDRKKKKRSRWGGSEHEKIFIPGMPTILPQNLGKEQEQAYLRKCYTTMYQIKILS